MNDTTTIFDAGQRLASQGLSFRPVNASDLRVIVRHRREMFAANGHGPEVLAPMTVAFEAWLAPLLASGAYFGWMVTDGAGEVVGGLGMMEIDWPPHPRHPRQHKRGYITNVFVEPWLRGSGVGRALMEIAAKEAGRRGLDLTVLHASPIGRPLYERMGWAAGSEMMLAVGVTGRSPTR
jgi:ribosomal protein S18 acetylase RimI-like enzyme